MHNKFNTTSLFLLIAVHPMITSGENNWLNLCLIYVLVLCIYSAKNAYQNELLRLVYLHDNIQEECYGKVNSIHSTMGIHLSTFSFSLNFHLNISNNSHGFL